MIIQILAIILPFIGVIIGFFLNIIIEMIKESWKKNKENKIKRNLLWNAFRESYENYVKLLALQRSLEQLNDVYRLSVEVAHLENKRFINLENSEYLNEDDNYFISKIISLKSKVNIINSFLNIKWKDIKNFSTKILIDYINAEIVIFGNLSLEFSRYLKMDYEKFIIVGDQN